MNPRQIRDRHNIVVYITGIIINTIPCNTDKVYILFILAAIIQFLLIAYVKL